MLIEETELRLGLVKLGRLTEYAALTLLADAQAHALTAETGGTLRDVADVSGATLYPGYFWTHLRVPPNRPLERHQIWDRVAVGVDVSSWGPVLDSSYVLGTAAELATPAAERPPLVAMRAASLWFIDGRHGEPQPSKPKAGTIAVLPRLEKAPAALETFREVRASGVLDPAFVGRLRLAEPLAVPIVAGRDAAIGRSLMFAQFVQIFDLGERALLERLSPPIHVALLDHLALLDRQVYYIDNCGPGSVVTVDVRARLEGCEPRLTGAPGETALAILKLALTAHEASSGRLLAVSTATKLLVVPKSHPSLVNDAERWRRQHGEDAP